MFGPTQEAPTMYVPHFDALLTNLGMTREEFASAERVMVPKAMLRFLMQVALTNSDFNETGYLESNPDVAAAVKAGRIESARLHYIGDGYFEDRRGATPEVDERWYLRTYTDVADAVRARTVESAQQHFAQCGATEMRAPSALYEPDAVQWARAVGKI
jgi:hypothetical protein